MSRGEAQIVEKIQAAGDPAAFFVVRNPDCRARAPAWEVVNRAKREVSLAHGISCCRTKCDWALVQVVSV